MRLILMRRCEAQALAARSPKREFGPSIIG